MALIWILLVLGKLHKHRMHNRILLAFLLVSIERLLALFDEFLYTMVSLELIVGLNLVDEGDELLVLSDHQLVLLSFVVDELLVVVLQFLGLIHEHDALLIPQECSVVNLESGVRFLSLLVLVNQSILNSLQLVVILHVDVAIVIENVVVIAGVLLLTQHPKVMVIVRTCRRTSIMVSLRPRKCLHKLAKREIIMIQSKGRRHLRVAHVAITQVLLILTLARPSLQGLRSGSGLLIRD